MTEISYDGQSFIVGGRRVWLVSGSIHYARMPRQLWRDRIRAAKQAGLNCIDTYVFWNLHEPKPKHFDFEGDLNLRKFIETVGQEGMYCILRPGPYVGSQWDFGGLPAWLHRDNDALRVRQANSRFLETSSRYLTAVLEQVKDLQVSTGGPILLMGAENRWFCDSPTQAQAYLRELCRYLRENGCTVPVIDCNNLWSTTEGAISCWSGSNHLAADLRQLRVVQPHAPRFILEYECSQPRTWGNKPSSDVDASLHLHRLASILGVGAQYNLHMFHGGTNFGFNAGQTIASRAAYTTTSFDCDAPLGESGSRGSKYLATKRISVFASQFGQLFAHLQSSQQHATISTEEDRRGISLFHQIGVRGQVIFILKGPEDNTPQTQLLLPNGLTLPVPLGDDQVAWVVLDADLSGVGTLDFTNLRPWAFINRKQLVLFGPPGVEGLVSINGALLHVNVPTGQKPLVQEHENLTVVVLNTKQVDAAYIGPTGLVVGANGLDDEDQAIPLKGWAHATTIESDGKTHRQPMKTAPRRTASRLTGWQQATLDDLIQGTSDQFEPMDGPASLESLGANYGYGWYRVSLKSSVKGKMIVPDAGDRLHLYDQGQLTQILGDGLGATLAPATLRLPDQLVVLADNLGRRADGWTMGERKGLLSHFYTVKPVTLGKPKLTTDITPDLSALDTFYSFVHRSGRSMSDSLTWNIRPKGKLPMVLEIDHLPWRVMVSINDTPIGAYDPESSGGRVQFTLRVGEVFRNRMNRLKLTFFEQNEARQLKGPLLSKHLHVYQADACPTAKGSWASAPWTIPTAKQFGSDVKSTSPLPCWWRCTFTLSHLDRPLRLEPVGMTKGQLYINGHNVGRYFVNTHKGKSVTSQSRYYLPSPWLRTGDHANELMLFDEHGESPTKCRLVYE